ncbi:hypothetical protein [Arundinibacter roseus]|uniref:Uncharacterized protein n=1 Tax=Arundinibacter roseus TaxID=2070510 RepID=A0A4R4KBD3_9BACT|nr:hypothetical protein [Arundinibacter roseus]TDB63781.1 hypothetical protein EZE20_15940 [Arundinibacter roseus]
MFWHKLCDPFTKNKTDLHAKPQHISQLMSSLLAALMLIVAVAGKSWTVPSRVIEKDKTEQTTKNTSSEAPVTVSELSLHAVVIPALSFDFAKSLFVLTHVFQYSFEEKIKVPLSCRTPFYYFSYFQYVFGHHIAPNAP